MIRDALKPLGEGPVLVHSDMIQVMRLVPRTKEQTQLLSSHVDLLCQLAAERDLWMPVFNYGFPATRRFEVATAPSQVGSLTEFFRQHRGEWRTAVPIFSISGLGQVPAINLSGRIDPFGDDSAFADLIRRDGTILFYGAAFSSFTMSHHIERLAGGPIYRYDKMFPGVVVLPDGQSQDVQLIYHVRPLSMSLEYDWARLASELKVAGILQSHDKPGERVMQVRARELRDFWLEKLCQDPFYLLDEATRAWVSPLFDRLQRRFRLEDFEGSPS